MDPQPHFQPLGQVPGMALNPALTGANGAGTSTPSGMAFHSPSPRRIMRVRVLVDWYQCTPGLGTPVSWWSDAPPPANEYSMALSSDGEVAIIGAGAEDLEDEGFTLHSQAKTEYQQGYIRLELDPIILLDPLGTIAGALLAVEKDGELYIPAGTYVNVWQPEDATDGHWEPLVFGYPCPEGSGSGSEGSEGSEGSAGSEGSEGSAGSGESGSGCDSGGTLPPCPVDASPENLYHLICDGGCPRWVPFTKCCPDPVACDNCAEGTSQRGYRITFSGITDGSYEVDAFFSIQVFEVEQYEGVPCNGNLDFQIPGYPGEVWHLGYYILGTSVQVELDTNEVSNSEWTSAALDAPIDCTFPDGVTLTLSSNMSSKANLTGSTVTIARIV